MTPTSVIHIFDVLSHFSPKTCHYDILGSKTTPHWGQPPTRPIYQLVKLATHQDEYLQGGELSWWGVVGIRIISTVLYLKQTKI